VLEDDKIEIGVCLIQKLG